MLLIWLSLFAAIILALTIATLVAHPRNTPLWLVILIIAVASALLVFPLVVFVRWLNCWRNFRRLLVGLAIFVTLPAILVTEENWRGKRAWDNYRRTAEARGERFDLASLVPPVPDDQNFFCATIVAEALDQIRKDGSDHSGQANYRLNFNIYRGDSKDWPPSSGYWLKGTLTDLKQWQTYFRTFNATPEGQTNGFPIAASLQSPAADVLLALSGFNPALELLRQASLRPSARIPLNYENGFETASELLPWLANMKRCAQFLELRILAELDNGQSDAALADVKLLFRVTDCVRQQPFLISQLVRIAMTAIALQPIYEGLAQHRWSDAQLANLEQMLAQRDYLADFEFAMKGENMTAIATFEKQRLTRESKQWEEHSGTNRLVSISYRFMPSAYFYQNELAFAHMHEQYILPLVDQIHRTVAPAALPVEANNAIEVGIHGMVAPATLRQAQAAIKSELKHYNPYKIQAQMFFPAVAASVKKFAMIQSQVDLASVACALERFRLAHGNYPDALDALAPRFITQLPHDLINGQPLHYRRTDDGKFCLYSVGWDEKDDGGKVLFTKGGSVDREKGDWVWQYPAK